MLILVFEYLIQPLYDGIYIYIYIYLFQYIYCRCLLIVLTNSIVNKMEKKKFVGVVKWNFKKLQMAAKIDLVGEV